MVVLARPLPLFDPQRGGPPADAIDIQLRMPRSMQVWCDDLARAGERHQLGQVDGVLHQLGQQLVAKVQRSCGNVEGDWPYAEGQIAVTPVVGGGRCDLAPGSVALRPHIHMYLGGLGRRLRDDAWVPVLWDCVAIGAYNSVWGWFSDRLIEASKDWGHRWDYTEPSGSYEIVDPPYAERGEAAGYDVCPGYWGPRRLILADESSIAAAAASEEARRAQQAAGITWSPTTVDGRRPPPDGDDGQHVG